jgi:hypothetical protein
MSGTMFKPASFPGHCVRPRIATAALRTVAQGVAAPLTREDVKVGVVPVILNRTCSLRQLADSALLQSYTRWGLYRVLLLCCRSCNCCTV